MGIQKKKSGGAKKIGRNEAKCKVYRQNGTREVNKARKAHKEEVKRAKLERKRLQRLSKED